MKNRITERLLLCANMATTMTSKGMISPTIIEKGTKCHVYMSFYEGPESFWLQLAENEDKLNDLQAEISEVHAESIYSIQCPISIGMYCIASFENVHYRAVISQILNDDTGIVNFIDYGNSEIVAFSELQRLMKTFTRCSSHAIHCSLPFNEYTSPNINLSHLTESNDLHVSVIDIGENALHHVQLITSKEIIPIMSNGTSSAVSNTNMNRHSEMTNHYGKLFSVITLIFFCNCEIIVGAII